LYQRTVPGLVHAGTSGAHSDTQSDQSMTWVAQLKQRARALRTETYALYLAARDPRTPWYAKLLVAGVVAYALSPIDLIPDFVPILGYLDDLVLLPLGIALAIKLVPDAVLADCRARASALRDRPVSWAAGLAVVVIWMLVLAVLTIWAYRTYRGQSG